MTVEAWDEWQADERERGSKRAKREAARAARRAAESHLAAMGTPAMSAWNPSATIPADGPNRLDGAGLDVLAAACASAPRCPRCRCAATPWEPVAGGPRRYVCFGCGYDPEAPPP